ncbi:MAG TPA: beta-ketoacyl synthase N-terminal-like domain-containing protein [Planctomycetota bacterium]|nr:beta-ketoacyl synthase N-terminal-like domain-containing protein [Planctomycetota bacterium]
MPIVRQFPAAITGVGLHCRREAPSHGSTRFFIHASDAALNLGEGERKQPRSLQFALSAARFAFGREFVQAGRPHHNDCGAVIVISKGLIESLEAGVEALCGAGGSPDCGVGGPPAPPISSCGSDAAASAVARALRLNGPAAAAVAACASGLASIKLGMDWLRDGACTAVLAGAAESSRSELILRSFERLGVISAQRRTRPFDVQRDGFVVGEGAAVFRLEEWERAEFNAERGTGPRVLGRILSVALGADAQHLTTPELSGATLAHVIGLALERAGLEPPQIGWVHAHGTATAYNDPVEIAALRRAFENKVPPVTATKGVTGHLLGASGPVALALALEWLREGTIPPIAGLEDPAPEFEGIDFVQNTPRRSSATHALVLNHGFGGHIAAAVCSPAFTRLDAR